MILLAILVSAAIVVFHLTVTRPRLADMNRRLTELEGWHAAKRTPARYDPRPILGPYIPRQPRT